MRRRFDQLPEVLQHTWQHLVRAVQDNKHDWHFPVVSSIGEEAADSRVVVLRQVDPTAHLLTFYTDWRSPKVRQLERNALLHWLFYDKRQGLQVRLLSRAKVHRGDELALSIWPLIPPHARRDYLSLSAPGTPLAMLPEMGDPLAAGHILVKQRDINDGSNFAVVRCEALRFDWLYLHPDGHQRAAFERSAEGLWSGGWLLP